MSSMKGCLRDWFVFFFFHFYWSQLLRNRCRVTETYTECYPTSPDYFNLDFFPTLIFWSHSLIWTTVKLLQTGQHWDKKIGRFRGVASFVRLPLQRIVRQGLKKLANILGKPVFWGSCLEKFHCNRHIHWVQALQGNNYISCSHQKGSLSTMF
jgi:hypothetical protein